MRAFVLAVVLFGLADATAQPVATDWHVLIVFDEDKDLPGLAAVNRSLQDAFREAGAGRVEFFTESLHLAQFGQGDYDAILLDHLRRKYAAKRIDVVVAVMAPSLDFLLRHRDELLPEVPIVFLGVDATDIAGKLPHPNVTGVVLARAFAPTVEVALRLMPSTRNVFVVSGVAGFDERVRRIAQQELQPFEKRVSLTYLTGLPMEELLAKAARFPPDSIVLYLTMFADREGHTYVPHEAAASVAAAASVPVFVAIDQYIGSGAVGGHVYSLSMQGRQAALMAVRVLRGESASNIPIVNSDAYQDVFDWRQLRHWGIDSGRLPPGSVVLFHQPGAWEQYKWYLLLALVLLIVQTLLIAGLLVSRAQRREEERRRREAETETRRQRNELAHALRVTTMGELTASFAHELNQPLSTIIANVDAARMLLSGSGSPMQQLDEALRDTGDAATRAAQTIRRLHALFRKQEAAYEVADVNVIVEDVLTLLSTELRAHRISVRLTKGASIPAVLVDPVQMRQVLMNLTINAMEAIETADGGPREIRVETAATSGGRATIVVQDTGIGAKEEQLEAMFDHFVTTKPNGLGMGLAISRTIVATHGGRIWATRNAKRGLAFHVELQGDPHVAAADVAERTSKANVRFTKIEA